MSDIYFHFFVVMSRLTIKECFLGDFMLVWSLQRLQKNEFPALAIEEPKEMLIFNRCQSVIFCPIAVDCTKVDVVFVSIARNFRDLSSVEFIPALHMYAVKSGMFVHQPRAGSGTEAPGARTHVRICCCFCKFGLQDRH